MDDDVVFFAMVQRYNIYFKYVSLHHDILGSHGAKSSTENIYWAQISFTTIIVGGVGLTSKLRAIERPRCIAHRGLWFEFLNV